MKTFRQALQDSALTVTAEPWSNRGVNVTGILRQAEILGQAVNGIQINTDPGSGVRASPIALAALMLRNGIDPIPQFNCRDRNRIALESDLLGLRALGVCSMLISQEGNTTESATPGEKPVLDVDCRELISMAADMGEEDWEGAEQEFVIGTETMASSAPDWKPDLLMASASAGARFLQTRLCLDPDLLRPWMVQMVEEKVTWQFSVIVTLAVLPSAEAARSLKENHTGAVLPSGLIDRLDTAADGEQEGIDICTELMRDIAAIPGVSGFNLLSCGRPEATVAAIVQSGILN